MQVWNQYENNHVLGVVDPTLEGQYPREQALRVIRIALLCTQGPWTLRPTMSQVVLMLSNNSEITDQPTQGNFIDDGAGRTANFNTMSYSATCVLHLTGP